MFTNVPLEETIQLLVDKAFINDWFNVTHHLDLSKLELLNLFRRLQRINFSCSMAIFMNRPSSPLGLLLANVFMSSFEETLEREGKMSTH